MEVAVAPPAAKPRITYAQFVASQHHSLTVAEVIGRFIKEMDSGVRPLGESHRLNLKRIERHWIGVKVAAALDKRDIIAYCRDRVATVCAATVGQDITFLTGALKYAGSAWLDCEKVSDAAVVAAKPFLVKHQLVGKSTPRTRRPTIEEKLAIEAHFERQNLHPRTKINMVRVSRWQHASSRRIGESCGLLWRDWTGDEQTILVRKMKDPKNRAKSKVVALPWDAQGLLLEWAYEMNARPELRTDEPRILPYNKHCCSQRYSIAKNKLGIIGLHLHDDRRDRASRLIEEDGYTADEAIVFTGHEDTKVFNRNYKALKPELMRFGPVAHRRAMAAHAA